MRPRTAALRLGVTVFLLLGATNLFGIHWFDEAYQVFPAWRINLGERLYTDVFVLTPPLHYYLVAAVQRVLGTNLLGGRILMALLGAIQCGLILRLAHEFLQQRSALAVAILSAICLLMPVIIPTYTATAMTLLVAGLWLLHGRGLPRAIAGGVCLGLAGTAKQDVGLAALAAGILVTSHGRLGARRHAHWMWGFGATGAALLLFAHREGNLSSMMRILLLEANTAKSHKLIQFGVRALPMLAFWGAVTAAIRWSRARCGASATRAILVSSVGVWITLCVGLNRQDDPVPYGLTYALLSAVFFLGHGLTLAPVEGWTDETRPLRRLAGASLTVFLISTLGGTDLPHLLQAMPLCFIPLVASWRRVPDLRGVLVVLAVGVAVVSTGMRLRPWHYSYAAFAPMAACTAWYKGVLVPPREAEEMKELESFLSSVRRAGGRDSLTMISYPSALANYLTETETPLRRFTFYFETPPDLGSRSRLVLVQDPEGEHPRTLPPELSGTYAGYRRLLERDTFVLWASPEDRILWDRATRWRRADTGDSLRGQALRFE